MEKRVRLRFAPSPTGPLHMGGVRTALYSFLYAKKHHGDFILRIEDTDQTRFVEGAEKYIEDSLEWCGIIPDEGVRAGGKHAPYRQSERMKLGIYAEFAQKLIDSGHAYYAFDTASELEEARKNAEFQKQTFSYCAQNRMKMRNSLTIEKNECERLLTTSPYVIRLKVETDEEIVLNDLIRGEVRFNSNLVDDKVLLKSDGMPTYHLAHIVDDYLMEITHAVRGEEWLPSAPSHVLIYRYLGLESTMPQYAHLPLLLKPDGNGKLSKRDGDRLGFPVFPLEWKDPQSGEISNGYREMGYEPEAFVNMLAFLGWNPGTNQEIMSMSELIHNFSFEHVHKAGAKFNPEKAIWFNTQYVHQLADDVLADKLKQQLINQSNPSITEAQWTAENLVRAVQLVKPRIHFSKELFSEAPYLFVAPQAYDQSVFHKKWKPELFSFFERLVDAFSSIAEPSAAVLEEKFKQTAAESNLKPGDVLPLLRLFISGRGSGVDLFGMAALLGIQEISGRIKNALGNLTHE